VIALFDDLSGLLCSLEVSFDGREFDDHAWLENEQTRAILYERGFAIAMAAMDSKQREMMPKNIDYRSLLALGRACAQFLDDRDKGLETPIANLALHKYIEQLVQNGEPDVFFEQQCKLRLITSDLIINYTTFRDAIAADGIGEEDIRIQYLQHIKRWGKNITQCIETLQLIGNPERPLNFINPENCHNTIFDYFICLAQAIRSMMLQYNLVQPILDLPTATEAIEIIGPLTVQSIEALAPHRRQSSAQFILFQTITAHMGIFMERETSHEIPLESLLDQCDRATTHLEEKTPLDAYITLFAHYLRVILCSNREELHEHLAQVKEDAMVALNESQQIQNYESYRLILEQSINDEAVNIIMVSDALAHVW
jgi:hypothetical protein